MASAILSILELLERLENLINRRLRISFDLWSVGDQRYYVADIRRFCAATAWQPRTDFKMGLQALCAWLEACRTAPGRGSRRIVIATEAQP